MSKAQIIMPRRKKAHDNIKASVGSRFTALTAPITLSCVEYELSGTGLRSNDSDDRARLQSGLTNTGNQPTNPGRN